MNLRQPARIGLTSSNVEYKLFYLIELRSDRLFPIS